jgi:hypothetical protein
MVGSRPAALVRALLASARAEQIRYPGRPRTVAWAGAVRDAAAWALGRASTAPISGRVSRGRPTAAALAAEDDAAEAAIHQAGRHEYAAAIQHTLMWIRGQTDDAPVSVTPHPEVDIWADDG